MMALRGIGLLLCMTALLFSEKAEALRYSCTNVDDSKSNWVKCGLRQKIENCIPEDWECDDARDCNDGSDELFCDSKFIWRYQYKYTGDVFFPKRSDGLYISTSISLFQVERRANSDIYIMELENPKLSQSRRHLRNLLLDDEIQIWEEPIKFEVLHNGAINKVYTYETSHPQDVLNIKKSIVSLFQFSLETKTKEVLETDPTGTCRVKYFIKKEALRTTVNGMRKTKFALYKYNVTKINDYTDCQDRSMYTFTNMKAVKCSKDSELQFPESNTRSSCIVYKHENHGKQFLHSCISHGRYKVNLSGNEAAKTPFVVNTERRLTFVGIDFSGKNDFGKFNSKSSLAFSFDGLTKPSKKEKQDDIDEIKGILDTLSKLTNKDRMAWDLLDYEVPKLYLHLVIHMRWRTKPSALKEFYTKFFKNKNYRIWLESALPFLGTGASGAEIHRLIESGEIGEEGAIKLFSRLGVVGEPEKELCEHVMQLCKSPKLKNGTASASCWLAFGSLVHNYCQHKTTCPKEFIKFLKDNYDENLHSQNHHLTVIKDNEKFVVALKAIGNAGQIQHLPLVLHILTTWVDHNAIMTAAIEALRRMPLQGNDLEESQKALLNLFVNMKMCPEIRCMSFSALLKMGPTTEMQQKLVATIRTEVMPTVKHYVYTHLDSESKTNCPAKKSYSTSVNLLAAIPHEEFDPRFSFSKSHLFDSSDLTTPYKHLISLESVHTTLSSMPRFLKIKNTVRAMGLDIDHMEFKVWQREIVPLIRDLIGPHGSVYQKKSLWDFIRPKRSSGDSDFLNVYKRMQETINPKTKGDIPFKLTLSSKLFGSEILYLVLNQSNPTIQSLVDDGTIKVDKDWWTNSLKAGMHLNLTAYDLLINSMLIVPTSIGLPLHLRAQMAGVLSLNSNGQLTTTPMLNLLSWNNKPKDISGSLKECYSLSTYRNARMYWFYRSSRMGYTTHHSVSSRCPLPLDKITFNAQPQSQKITLQAMLRKEKYVFSKSSFSTELFARINGKDDYAERIDMNLPSQGENSFGGGPFGGGPLKANPIGNPFGKSGPKPNLGQIPFGAGLKPNSGVPPLGRGPKPPFGGGIESQTSSASSASSDPLWKDTGTFSSKSESSNRTIDYAAWYDPGKNVITSVEARYKNLTQDKDKKMRYNIQFRVNGEGKNKIAEFHLQLNLTKQNSPSKGPLPFTGLSIKSSKVKNGKSILAGCHVVRWDVPNMRLDMGTGWGQSSCTPNIINTTFIYNGEIKKPRLDIYFKWDALPGGLERFTCPQQFMMKEMEKLKKLGQNAGSGAQGGQGSGPPFPHSAASGGQGGANAGHAGANAGMGIKMHQKDKIKKMISRGGNQGGSQPFGGYPGFPGGFPGGPSGVPGNRSSIPQFPCFKSLNLSISIQNGQELNVTGFPTPDVVVMSYKLPFNATKGIAKAKEILTNGITATCTAHYNTDEIQNFDHVNYIYSQSKGCPHVLAKDCSKKDLFAVFLTKNDKNKKEVQIVVKDVKGKRHSIVIKPDLTVEYDGSILQLQGDARLKFAKLSHGCEVKNSMKHLVVKCDVGLIVTTDLKKIKVQVTPWYFRYMCGLCGNYDWIAFGDLLPSSSVNKEDDFGSNWLVPGKDCNSECKLTHHAVVDTKAKSGKTCVTTSPVTRCARNCKPTKTITSKRSYHCVDDASDLAKKTQQHVTNNKINEVIKIFRNRPKDLTIPTSVHMDCQCTCPASSP